MRRSTAKQPERITRLIDARLAAGEAVTVVVDDAFERALWRLVCMPWPSESDGDARRRLRRAVELLGRYRGLLLPRPTWTDDKDPAHAMAQLRGALRATGERRRPYLMTRRIGWREVRVIGLRGVGKGATTWFVTYARARAARHDPCNMTYASSLSLDALSACDLFKVASRALAKGLYVSAHTRSREPAAAPEGAAVSRSANRRDETEPPTPSPPPKVAPPPTLDDWALPAMPRRAPRKPPRPPRAAAPGARPRVFAPADVVRAVPGHERAALGDPEAAEAVLGSALGAHDYVPDEDSLQESVAEALGREMAHDGTDGTSA